MVQTRNGVRVKMPKSWIRWQRNPQFTSVDSESRGKQDVSMLDMVKADLKTGALTDWGMCYDQSAGYAFSELSEQDLYGVLRKWMPYVKFDVKPVLDVDQVKESIKKAAAAK